MRSAPVSGSPAIVSSAAALEIEYTAADHSYALSDGTRTQSFALANQDASRSTANLTAYATTAGTTTDILLLARTGTAAAYPAYYVGAGAWIQTMGSTPPADAAGTAFAYGFPTEVANVPSTGARRYAVDLVATEARGDSVPAGQEQILQRIGEGYLTIDFAAGSVALTVARHPIANEGSSIGGAIPSTLTGTGTLAADRNSFSGTITGSRNFTGRLYGPAAEEVGLAFNGSQSSGAIIGHEQAPFEREVADLAQSMLLDKRGMLVRWQGSGDAWTTQTGSSSFGDFRYSTLTDAFHFSSAVNASGGNSYALAFPRTSMIAGESSAERTAYGFRLPGDATLALETDFRLFYHHPEAVDPALTLHYSLLDHLQGVSTSNGPYSANPRFDEWSVAGRRTPASAIPTSGTFRYRGIGYGQYFQWDPPAGAPFISTYHEATATFDLTFDFATRTFAGSVVLTRHNSDGSSVAFPANAVTGTIAADGALAGVFPSAGSSPSTVASPFNGLLFGPNASEVGFSFEVQQCYNCSAYAPPHFNDWYGAMIGTQH